MKHHGKAGVSRRGLFSIFARPAQPVVRPAPPPAPMPPSEPVQAPDPGVVAVIQGRFCIAYHAYCTMCSDRCPESGAIEVTDGIPMVVPEKCTGCRVCHEVCPAPTNAILMAPRRPLRAS